MGALVLDFLLVIIFLMMVPIGFFRGGLRELSTSAGLLLGILMAQEWAEDWSGVARRIFSMSEGASILLMGSVIAFGITALIGYGGSAAFAYRPGPGGRLYGAFLALLNAMVGAGFLINLYARTIGPTVTGEQITSGIVARTLSAGFGSVLLTATIGIGIATVFGMFVRERSDDVPGYQAPTPSLYQSPSTRPYRVEEDAPVRTASEPVRIRDVQTVEDDEKPSRPDPTQYGTGWRQTWPESKRDSRAEPRPPSTGPSQSSPIRKPASTSKSRDVLADWVKDQGE